MQTLQALTTSQKINEALNKGFKKKVIVEASGLSFNTFQKRLKDNSWESQDIKNMQAIGVI